MSEARTIFKNSGFLAAARVTERLAAVVLVLLVARALGASALGVYAAAIAFYGLFQVAGDLGASNLLVRDIARDRSLAATYLVHLGALGITLAAIATATAWLVLPHAGLASDLEVAFRLVVLAIIPGVLRVLQEAVFVAFQRVELQAFVTFVASLATIVATIVLIRVGEEVVALLIAFVVAQWAITLVYVVLIARFITPLRCSWSFDTMRSLIRDMRAFVGLSVLAALFARPEVLILAVASTTTQAGYFSAALRVVMVWQIIPQTLMVNVFPVLSRAFKKRADDFKRIPEKATKYLLAVTLPISAGILVAAEPLIDLLFGSDFGPAVSTLRILALSIPIFSINSVLWRVLVARDKQGQLLSAFSGAVIIRIGIGIALAIALGSLGAAIAGTVVLALYNVALAFLVRRNGIRLQLMPLGERFFPATLAMALVTWLLVPFVAIWFIVPIAALVYVAIVWRIRAFSPDDIQLFRSIVRPEGTR